MSPLGVSARKPITLTEEACDILVTIGKLQESHNHMRLAAFVIATLVTSSVAPASPAPDPQFRVESEPIATGADLITVFGSIPEKSGSISVPLIAVLRDTLGDQNPDNDRLRYVWVLTSTRPTLLQRGVATIPFFYWRPDLGKNADSTPAPAIDLGATSHPVWKSLAGSATQVMALNSNGTLLRASSQRYRGNVQDHQQAQFIEGLAVLSRLEKNKEAGAVLRESERVEIESRLTLASKTLGGLVNSQKLPQAYLKQRTQTTETLGHNWELLRQRAEANGLYFEPLGSNATHALLWVSKEDAVATGADKRHFDGRLLGIANPFGDARIKSWTGYSVRRSFDPEGRVVSADAPGAHQVELIPLALYALDYPKVPLLLADFRAFRSAKRREMLRRALTDTASGVLGITKWGNWPYLAGTSAWNFVRTRHGDPGNREARLRAYSGVRQWLSLDTTLDGDLRKDLQKRLEVMSINPLEESVFSEPSIAYRQFGALLKYAQDPSGLAKRLERDRQSELTADNHSFQARIGLKLAHYATFGGYSHHEVRELTMLTAELDRFRRAQRQEQFLQTVANSSPQVDVVWNMEQVQHSIDDLVSTGLQARNAALLQRILQQTKDPETRAQLFKALGNTVTEAGE